MLLYWTFFIHVEMNYRSIGITFKTKNRRSRTTILVLSILATMIIPASFMQTTDAALTSFSDFDGDGFGDICVGVPFEDVSGAADAGAINCIYGSAAGAGTAGRLTDAGDQFITQPMGAIPGGPEAGDRFGSSLAVGNFNGDAFDDVCVGVPGEDIGAGPIADAGLVHCFFGSSSGLVTSPGQVLTQNVGGIPDSGEIGDQFGYSLAAGNFNTDSFTDLCIGIPFENVVGMSDAGAVNCMEGTGTGLSTLAADNVYFHQDSVLDGVAIPGGAEASDHFGWSLAGGNYNAGAATDLCVGVPDEDIPAGDDAGVVYCISGAFSPDLLDITFLNLLLTQDSSTACGAIPGGSEGGDRFGYTLTTGDFNVDDNADLAIAVPFEDFSGDADAGFVDVVYGPLTGTCTGGDSNDGISQDIAALSGFDPSNPGDLFGWSLAAGDFGGDDDDDLCVGVPLEDVVSGAVTISGAGAINCIYGSTDGLVLTAGSGQFWHQDVAGIGGVAETFDELGYSLTSGDYDGNGIADVCTGVPFEDFAATNDGVINCIYAAPGGLVTTGNEFWGQSVGAIDDTGESGDLFGYSVSSEVPVTASAEGQKKDDVKDDVGGVEIKQGSDSG